MFTPEEAFNHSNTRIVIFSTIINKEKRKFEVVSKFPHYNFVYEIQAWQMPPGYLRMVFHQPTAYAASDSPFDSHNMLHTIIADKLAKTTNELFQQWKRRSEENSS